jgi:hypothetical protein
MYLKLVQSLPRRGSLLKPITQSSTGISIRSAVLRQRAFARSSTAETIFFLQQAISIGVIDERLHVHSEYQPSLQNSRHLPLQCCNLFLQNQHVPTCLRTRDSTRVRCRWSNPLFASWRWSKTESANKRSGAVESLCPRGKASQSRCHIFSFHVMRF